MGLMVEFPKVCFDMTRERQWRGRGMACAEACIWQQPGLSTSKDDAHELVYQPALSCIIPNHCTI
jgi:hypothetical protein